MLTLVMACFAIVTVCLRYSWFHRAEVGLGLGWDHLVLSVRFTHSYPSLGVRLTRIYTTSVRLTHT